MSHPFHMSEPIALHPHPFIHHHNSSDRSSDHRKSPRPQSTPKAGTPKGGSSTAVESHELDSMARRLQASSYDLENRQPPHDERSDPYGLSAQLQRMQELSSTGQRKLRKHYNAQIENVERLLKDVNSHREEAKAEQDADSFQLKSAVWASLIANFALAGIQLYGAISSGSLSLFTTTADALFDPMSNLMLFLVHNAVKKVNPRKYPSGKARIENAGNISFCFLMFSVSVVLIVESIRQLVTGNGDRITSDFNPPSIIAVGIACVVKLCLFLYCHALRNKYSQVRILWEDHRNDVIINGVGLATSVMGSFIRWWIDPMGAILLSVLIATLWMNSAYREFQMLVGVSADPEYLQLITYISMTHSKDIVALDTVRAWHSGPRYIVEVDIVMDPSESLREAHDVAQDLQDKLESLPDVERAYVHVDYETDHAPEHFLKKEL